MIPKIFLARKNLVKKYFGRKKFGQKNLSRKKNFGPEMFEVRKVFCQNKLVRVNSGVGDPPSPRI